MKEDRQVQERKSDLLRRQRVLQQLQRGKNSTQHATQQLDGTAPIKHTLHLFQRKSKNNSPREDTRSSPFANENLQIKPEKSPKKRLHLSWRILSGLLTIMFLFFLTTAWQSTDFQVSVIDVKGNQRINQDEIIKTLTVMNEPLFTVQPDEIAQTILSTFPELKDVKVTLYLPNKISITVNERQPYIAWQLEKQTLWMDSDGFLFPARGQASSAITIQSLSYPSFYTTQPGDQAAIQIEKYHPKLNDWKSPPDSMTWFKYHQQIDPGLLTAILKLNVQIPSQKALLFDSNRGLGWTDEHGWKIFVGFDLDHIDEKWLMYEKISADLVKQGIKPSLVSVEYLHAPYYRVD